MNIISPIKDHNRDALHRLENYRQNYLGLAEFAAIIGTSKQTLNARLNRRRNYPRPIAELRMGPIWTKELLQAWLNTDP